MVSPFEQKSAWKWEQAPKYSNILYIWQYSYCTTVSGYFYNFFFFLASICFLCYHNRYQTLLHWECLHVQKSTRESQFIISRFNESILKYSSRSLSVHFFSQEATAAGYILTSAAEKSRPGAHPCWRDAASLQGHWRWIWSRTPDPNWQSRAHRSRLAEI